MKIFFSIKSLHLPAGTERATITIANELARRKHDVGIISLEKVAEPFFSVDSNIQFHYLYHSQDKRPSLVRDFSRRKKLKEIYRIEKPDIVVIVGSGRSFLNIPAARGIKKITWEHFNLNINWHLLHPLSKRMAARFSDCIVTLTQQDAINYEQKFSIRNVVCIPNSISIDDSTPSPLTEKRVLAIGRFVNQKGYDYLIDAWERTENRKHGWKLRVIGNGNLLPVIIEKIKQLQLEDSIEIIHSTNNVNEHYLQSSIYVMSSRYEGLPLVLIEAMAIGLPIVSFDCETGPRDIVEHGVTGILVPVFDVEKLALELDNLMSDEQKRKLFSENALKNVRKFETAKIVDEWEELFQNILEK